MELSFQYWYMFPISIVAAAIAIFTAPGVLNWWADSSQDSGKGESG